MFASIAKTHEHISKCPENNSENHKRKYVLAAIVQIEFVSFEIGDVFKNGLMCFLHERKRFAEKRSCENVRMYFECKCVINVNVRVGGI